MTRELPDASKTRCACRNQYSVLSTQYTDAGGHRYLEDQQIGGCMNAGAGLDVKVGWDPTC